MSMWKSLRMLAPAAALLAGSLVLSADTFVPFVVNLDENGTGSISISHGPFTPLPGVLAPDPSNGGALALTYFFPASAPFLGTGTLLSYEDSSLTSLSDALRFTDATGNISGSGTADRMIFYSDAEPGDTALADTGFPSNITSGGAIPGVEAIGAAAGLPPGDSGFTFIVPDKPGTKCPDCEIFHVISEQAVPEPASCVLLLTVLGLVGVPRLRTRFRGARSPEPDQTTGASE